MCDKETMAAICDCHYYRGHLSTPAKGFCSPVVSTLYYMPFVSMLININTYMYCNSTMIFTTFYEIVAVAAVCCSSGAVVFCTLKPSVKFTPWSHKVQNAVALFKS